MVPQPPPLLGFLPVCLGQRVNYGIQEEDCGLKLKVFGEAVVMRAWRAFLSSVNSTFIVNFFLAFSLSLIYLLSFLFFFFIFFLLSFY